MRTAAKLEAVPTYPATNVPPFEEPATLHNYIPFRGIVPPVVRAEGRLWKKGQIDIVPQLDIAVAPQVLFRPMRIAVRQDCAQYFEVLDLRSGKNSQTLGGAVSARFFPPLPARGEVPEEDRAMLEKLLLLRWDAVHPGQMLIMQVRNISSEPQPFEALVWGIMAD